MTDYTGILNSKKTIFKAVNKFNLFYAIIYQGG